MSPTSTSMTQAGQLINSSEVPGRFRPSTSPIAPISRLSNQAPQCRRSRSNWFAAASPDIWATVIARKVTGPNGEFPRRHVASDSIPPISKISSLRSRSEKAPRFPCSIAMERCWRAILTPKTLIGKNFKIGSAASARCWPRAAGRPRAWKVPVDHRDRLGSAAALEPFPDLVVATTTTAAALADWRAQTKFMVVAAVLSALVIAFILFLIIRQMTRQNRESQQRLELQKHRLDTALNNMTQGLVLYDASARVIICNQRYLDMYGLSSEVVKPGCPLPRPDPAPQGDRILRRRRRRILFVHPAQRRAGQGHRQDHGSRERAFGPHHQPAAGRRAAGSRPSKTSPSGETSSRNATATTHSCARSSTTSPRRSP